MMEIKAKELSLVLIGNFNPVIINPNWLLAKELISSSEADMAVRSEKYISHPEITQFELENYNIRILQDKFLINGTQESYFENMCLLAREIFSILKETPIGRMGFNIIHHYEVGNEESWRKFGDFLAPKDVWRKVMNDPGLKRMEILAARDDDKKGQINAMIGISELPRLKWGLRIQVNDHYDLYTQEEYIIKREATAVRCLEVLEDWQNSIVSSEKIITEVVKHATQ